MSKGHVFSTTPHPVIAQPGIPILSQGKYVHYVLMLATNIATDYNIYFNLVFLSLALQ